MKFKHIFSFSLILAFLLMSAGDLDAQSRSNSRKQKQKERERKERAEAKKQEREDNKRDAPAYKLQDHLWYGLSINSPGFTQGGLNAGVGPMAAYKFNDIFSAGIATSFDLYYEWIPGQSQTYYDYSVGVFTRAKIFQRFYAHVGYNFASVAFPRFAGDTNRVSFPTLLGGGGYQSSVGTIWNYDISLLYDFRSVYADPLKTDRLANYRFPILYRIGITYNF